MRSLPTFNKPLRSHPTIATGKDLAIALLVSWLLVPVCFGEENESKFPIVRREIPHGPRWISTIEYPVVGDPMVDAAIRSVVKEDCYSANYSGQMTVDDGRCSQKVSAVLVRGEFLVLTIDNFEYRMGFPHGDEERERRTFKRSGNGWDPVKKNGLISDSVDCQKRIASLVYSQIKPQVSEKQVQGFDTPSDIWKMATQVPTENGVRFEYQADSFNASGPPRPAFVTYEVLGSCFAPTTMASDAH